MLCLKTQEPRHIIAIGAQGVRRCAAFMRQRLIFSFFVMVVAAAEAAVGLAIILTIFKNRQTLEIDEVSSLKN